jgi:hypothetical protein
MKPTPAKTNPFPGLRPFTQEEDYLFFGREEQTLELLQRLGSNRFVAVVGTSGSGKSSLVRCGLLSELLGGRMLEAGAAWEIAVTHPGGNPLALLAEALLDADLYDREQEDARENLLATLSRSHFGLVEAVKQANLGDGTNFLLVVDQFEEVFRFHEAGLRQQEAANEFVSLLLEATAQKEVPIYIVLTMRSDFIGECGQFEGLAEMVNRGEFLIPRLSREQFKRVVEGPIKVAGGQIAEMAKNEAESFCCGAGGGRILAEEKLGTRISETRAKQAAETGAPLLLSNCPFCLTMFEDGIKGAGFEGQLAPKDIAEVLAERLQG